MENNQPIRRPVLMDASSGPTKAQLEKARLDFASYVPEKIEPFDFDALLLQVEMDGPVTQPKTVMTQADLNKLVLDKLSEIGHDGSM